jgi:2-dehydropantoate 2-reductase
MKVLVMGSGGVGGYYGALLARMGHNVTFIARGPHLEAMQRDGLRVESDDEPPFTVPVKAMPRPVAGAPNDLVIFAVKAYDTATAAAIIRPIVHAQTMVLSLQNGVDSGDQLTAEVGADHVLAGPVYVVSSIASPGVVRRTGAVNRVVFGPLSPAATTRASEILAEAIAAGWPAELTAHPLRELWTKLAFLGPFAATTTLTGVTAEQLRSDPSSAALVRAVMAEYVAVATAEGADLPANAMDAAFETLMRYPGEATSSMARDREAGKRLETEALVSTVSRRGKDRAVPTPITNMLTALLAPLTQGT